MRQYYNLLPVAGKLVYNYEIVYSLLDLVENATTVQPPEVLFTNQFLWQFNPIKRGVFDPKTETWQIVDADVWHDGDTVEFQNNRFVVTKKGLQALKIEKRSQLLADFQNNKLYIIENGEQLIIDNNSSTPDGSNARDLFNNILEGALNMPAGQNDTSVKLYQQQVGESIFRISGVNTVWQYLLKDLFYFTQNGLLYNIRQKNKCLYDEKLNNIKNATTLEELNAIEWKFVAHPKINVDEVAKRLLNNNTIPESVKDLIRLREMPVGSGHYKLIEKI